MFILNFFGRFILYIYPRVVTRALYVILFVPYQPARDESESLITVLKMQGVPYGNRCFGKVTATLWNNLPLVIRKCKNFFTFKKKIKTNLFITAYSTQRHYLNGWFCICMRLLCVPCSCVNDLLIILFVKKLGLSQQTTSVALLRQSCSSD